VTPASVALNDRQTQQFSATAKDQFGAAMSPQPGLNWSATGGTVDASGLYSAPFAAGNLQVTAASGAMMGTANVTVSLLKGDLDGDGQRTIADISALSGALSDLDAYQSAHSFGGGDLAAVANIDSDNSVNNLDLQSLIVLLANGGAGGGSAAASVAVADAQTATAAPAISPATTTITTFTAADEPTDPAADFAAPTVPPPLTPIAARPLLLPTSGHGILSINGSDLAPDDVPPHRSADGIIETAVAQHAAVDSFFNQIGLQVPIARRWRPWVASVSDDFAVSDDFDHLAGSLPELLAAAD
jgi:hypothetical protein